MKANIEKIRNGGFGKAYNAQGGACVVMNVKNGEVLAMASYPDYNPQSFANGIGTEEWNNYLNNEAHPLLDKTIQSAYAPGSIFKMVTAIAGLESGSITLNDRINDVGQYKKYGATWDCWYYTDYHRGHGSLNVIGAIEKSCNYFFYETADRMGIDNLNKYAKYFGLGTKTGIELPNETAGTLASKDYVKSIKQNWNPGDTLNAAIGQGYNRFTPLQMAKYISMIANGGNKIDATIIKTVQNSDGTEVSKDASSMILADDNFATIIKAVLNGRNVYRNIKNAIQFLLSGNMAAIIAVLVCSVVALPSPFKPVHLLFINLLTDSLPALAIGMEPSDPELLKQKPRNPEEGILTGKFVSHLFGYGALIAAATMAAFCIGLNRSDAMGATMAFATLTLARLFHGFTCRSERSLVDLKFSTNLWSIGAFAAGTLLLAAVLFLPGLQILFEVTPLSGIEYATILGLAITPTIFIQGYKFITSKKRKNLLK